MRKQRFGSAPISARRWLSAAGYWQSQSRKVSLPHPPRARRLKRSELIQIDGSDHQWLGEWRWTLLQSIDDATSEVLYAMFVPSESTFSDFDALSGHITRHGLPQAIYCDRHSVFFAAVASGGTVPLTAFGRALARLEIEHIPSSCPRGRGRVERAHRTAQDSLLKEMANQIDLSDQDEATTMTAANEFLPGWIVQRNIFFAVPAGDPEDAPARARTNMKLCA